MDFCRNVTVSGEYQSEHCSKLGAALTAGNLDDFFPAQNTEVDVSLEWLSIFVEDCLSSTGNCLPAPTAVQDSSTTTTTKPTKPLQLQQKPQQNPPSLQKFVVPGKARSKRKRATSAKINRSHPLTSWSYNQGLNLTSSDPPLLQQAYWLADSELIVPKKQENSSSNNNNMVRDDQEESKEEEVEFEEEESKGMVGMGKELEGSNGGQGLGQQPRRCTHCLAQRTPQWRAGPLGPKTLCNACGVRYKSGRLLPEYRPAKSPTFVSYLHSNSHKKVMEMRMASAVFHS